MSQHDYQAMSDEALRTYFIRHKNDKEALSAYLSRINVKGKDVITQVGAPDFDDKIQAAILQQMKAAQPVTQQKEIQSSEEAR